MQDIIKKLEEIGHGDIADELEELKDDMILDMGNFKRELDRQGLNSNELNEFIENYMRWDNT